MITRRDFLKRTAALTAAGFVMPSLLEEDGLAARTVAASDRINVALLGCRSMGWADLSDFLLHPEVNCTALCDVDRQVLDDTANKVKQLRNGNVRLYGDYRKLLEQPDIDVVIIGTPDHWHCLQMTDACAAGKDVYVEKPIANSIAECDAMVAAARKYDRVVQVGQQQRSGSHWHEMKRYIDSGKLGKITKVNVWANFRYAVIGNRAEDSEAPSHVDFDMWLGPAPKRPFNANRFHGSWRMFWDYGGGLMTDWGVHLIDMALWAMDIHAMPGRVFASGGVFSKPNYAETFDTLSVVYEYDDFLIEWTNVANTETGPYNRCYGLEFKGENGTLVANRDGWEVLPVNGKIEAAKVAPDYEDHKKHVADFLDCLKKRDIRTACPIDNGSLCAKYAHLGNIAARTRSVLVYDDVKKTFRNREADALIEPEYRKQWKFPKA